MKILKTKNILLTFVFTFLLIVKELIAKNQPPTPKGSGGFDDKWAVGGSIDSYVPLLIVIGLTIGIWGFQKQFKISKNN